MLSWLLGKNRDRFDWQEDATLRTKHLIGLPVLNVATGEQVAVVRSSVIDLVNGHVRGIVVHRGNLWRETQGYQWAQLHAVGQDAILLRDDEQPLSLDAIVSQFPAALTGDKLFGRQVLTEAGRVLGALDDVTFDAQGGRISHYWLADGLLQSMLNGSATIPAPTQPVLGESHIIVPTIARPVMTELVMKINPPDV